MNVRLSEYRDDANADTSLSDDDAGREHVVDPSLLSDMLRDPVRLRECRAIHCEYPPTVHGVRHATFQLARARARAYQALTEHIVGQKRSPARRSSRIDESQAANRGC